MTFRMTPSPKQATDEQLAELCARAGRCVCCHNDCELGAEMCPRCQRIHDNRERRNAERVRHDRSVAREVTARRLDEIDRDWPNRFRSTDEAARHYRDELLKRAERQVLEDARMIADAQLGPLEPKP